MKIQPIKLKEELLINNRNKNENKERKDSAKNITAFPKGYGCTNIAFCAKQQSNNSDSVKISSNQQSEKSNPSRIISNKGFTQSKNAEIPYFEPYKYAIEGALHHLSLKQPCLLFYSDKMDSKELLLNNLRKALDDRNSNSAKFGLKQGIPIITFNCADYAENASVEKLKEDVRAKIKESGQNNVILVADNSDALFDVLERPSSFFKSALFSEHPTIFLTEEKYQMLTKDEKYLYDSRFYSSEEIYDDNPALEYTKGDINKITSKFELLSQNTVGIPVVKYKDALKFLMNPVVQKQLLAKGKDIKFAKSVIPYSINAANADLLYSPNIYGTAGPQYLIKQNATALDNAINMLKLAAVNAITTSSKEVTIENFKKIYPYDSDGMIIGYKQAIEEYKAEVEEAKNKNLKKNNEKTIVNNTNDETNSKEPNNKVEARESVSGDSKISVIKNVQTKFSDVGGMYNVKEQLKEEILNILNNKKLKNSQKPSGILLYGPPGCGKTLLARAIAGEAGVPFIATSGSSFVEIYVGTGPKAVRELYETAEKEARNHPSKTAIVFIDEVDSAAGNRKSSSNDEDTKTVDALLHEMDGTKNKGESDVKIITIVATNNKDMLDSAFTREGRIDVKCCIEDPKFSTKARREILNIHAKDMPFENGEIKEELLRNLAEITAGLSGAQLAEIIKKANRLCLQEGRKNVITQEDIHEAKERVLRGAKTDREYNEYEKRQTIAREAGHAINSIILEKIFEGEEYKHKKPLKILDFISNTARGDSLGKTYFRPSSDNQTISKESCFADVITLYGSCSVETLMFDTHTSNVEKDMEDIAKIVEKAVTEYDFGTTKRHLSIKSNNTLMYLYGVDIKNDIDLFTKKGMEISNQMIQFAKPFIEKYVNLLIEKNYDKEVTAEDFKIFFNDWLKNNKKQVEYEKLCSNLKTKIDDFCKEKEPEKQKLGFPNNIK